MTPAGLVRLKLDEGCRLDAYLDGGGVWTIGYGHTGRLVHQGLSWPQSIADAVLETDVAIAEHGIAQGLPWFSTIDPVRQDCMTNIAFNVGVSGLLKWPTTLGHIQFHDYFAAANDLLHEGPWDDQVGARADRLAQAMYSGSWASVVQSTLAPTP